MEGNLSEEEKDKKPLSKTASEYFHEAFPMYLAIGMTYEEFWEKESWLVKSYRKAQKIKHDEVNYSAWLHGVYVLNALQSGVPVILNGIAKEKIDLPSFPEKPIDFSENQRKKQEQKQMELQRAKMLQIAEQFNATFRRKHPELAEKHK